MRRLLAIAANGFRLGDHHLFSNASLRHTAYTHGDLIWNFHFQSEHWRVKGHWVNISEVHGSICNLVHSPSGCPDGHQLQTYTAHGKSPK